PAAAMCAPSPYTTLFRSGHRDHGVAAGGRMIAEEHDRLPGRRDLDGPRHDPRAGQAHRCAEGEWFAVQAQADPVRVGGDGPDDPDRKSTRLNSSHVKISY